MDNGFETLVEEFLSRDMVPEDIESEVRTLHAEGKSDEALQLIISARRRDDS